MSCREQKSYKDIRNCYFKAREDEWKRLRNELRGKLKEKNFCIPPQGGAGSKHYGKKKYGHDFDLSYWRWIDVKKDDLTVTITLQCFDYDVSSKNIHVLLDRVGLFIEGDCAFPLCVNGKKIPINDAIYRMYSTNWDLPLDEDKIEKLSQIMIEIDELYRNCKTCDWEESISKYLEKQEFYRVMK